MSKSDSPPPSNPLRTAALYASLASVLAPTGSPADGLPVYPGGNATVRIDLPFTPIPVDSDRDDGDGDGDGDDGGDDPSDSDGSSGDADPCGMADDDSVDDRT